MKNSVVTTAIAEVLVDAGWLVVVAVLPTLAIAMKLISSLYGVFAFRRSRFALGFARVQPSPGYEQRDPPIISHSLQRRERPGFPAQVAQRV
jgi:hypothetical protein